MGSSNNLLPYFITDTEMVVREKSTSLFEDRVEIGIVSKETSARRLARWKLPSQGDLGPNPQLAKEKLAAHSEDSRPRRSWKVTKLHCLFLFRC